MAGLGTMADMVPLRNENRIFAYYGLMVLQKTKRPGLISLLRKMNIEPRRLNEEDIGFMIAPRINAASRMDIPRRAFELLSTVDHEEAKNLAEHLSRINDDRKTSVAVIMREINKKFIDREDTPVIVVGNPTWNAGVLGLVASKIVETYNRPAFVWGGETDDGFKGSCRGDGTINVVELMRMSQSVFVGFGGHEHAGGFSVSHEKVVILESTLIESTRNFPAKEKTTQNEIVVDAILEITDINSRIFSQINPLAPFGVDNPRPVFLLKNIKLVGVKHFGKENNHLEIVVSDEKGKSVKAIKFFAGTHSFEKTLEPGITIDLICTIEQSFFGGKNEIRLRIIDIL
jgi:single-stranded-DNA-specific exonuclease